MCLCFCHRPNSESIPSTSRRSGRAPYAGSSPSSSTAATQTARTKRDGRQGQTGPIIPLVPPLQQTVRTKEMTNPVLSTCISSLWSGTGTAATRTESEFDRECQCDSTAGGHMTALCSRLFSGLPERSAARKRWPNPAASSGVVSRHLHAVSLVWGSG